MAEPLTNGGGQELPLVPARMLNEYAYCPRLFYLEWVHGEWAENYDTAQGSAVHERVDREAGGLAPPDDMAGAEGQVQAYLLSAPRLGMIARIDVLELLGGKVLPVDYKKGRPGPSGPWEPDVLQICAQGMILKENGYRCEKGIVYYASTRERVEVPITAELEGKVLQTLAALREAALAPSAPPPLVDSAKCFRCSLAGICLPDETNLLNGLQGEVRRLAPAHQDAAPLYVLEQGSVVSKDGDRLAVRTPEGEVSTFRLLDVSQISLYGNVQITSQAVRAVAERGVPVFHHTYGGWLVAVTSPAMGQNVHVRVAQYGACRDEAAALPVARAIVAGKLKNQRTLLRRNHPQLKASVAREMDRLAGLARGAASLERLFGIEGMGARLYFRHFAGMLKESYGFEVEGRAKRPAPDPVNALLSFLYSLLLKDAVKALLVVGLDPYAGLFHRLRPGRPSLALDLMEEFRPLIADSVVLRLLNTGTLTAGDFVRRGPACALKDGARRKAIEAYEARMNSLVTHPIFGYRVSYRRVVEIQARLLSRAITGEISQYPPFVTR